MAASARSGGFQPLAGKALSLIPKDLHEDAEWRSNCFLSNCYLFNCYLPNCYLMADGVKLAGNWRPNIAHCPREPADALLQTEDLCRYSESSF